MGTGRCGLLSSLFIAQRTACAIVWAESLRAWFSHEPAGLSVLPQVGSTTELVPLGQRVRQQRSAQNRSATSRCPEYNRSIDRPTDRPRPLRRRLRLRRQRTNDRPPPTSYPDRSQPASNRHVFQVICLLLRPPFSFLFRQHLLCKQDFVQASRHGLEQQQ